MIESRLANNPSEERQWAWIHCDESLWENCDTLSARDVFIRRFGHELLRNCIFSGQNPLREYFFWGRRKKCLPLEFGR